MPSMKSTMGAPAICVGFKSMAPLMGWLWSIFTLRQASRMIIPSLLTRWGGAGCKQSTAILIATPHTVTVLVAVSGTAAGTGGRLRQTLAEHGHQVDDLS